MRRVQVRHKDIEPLLQQYHIEVSRKDHMELLNEQILLINHVPAFFLCDGKYSPTLQYLMYNHDVLKKITVDMGAVPFVVSGADIMRPGIVEIESEISAGDFVVIVDQTHKKMLSVGVALFSSSEMRAMTAGKVVKNIHYVGDIIWKN